MFGTPFARLLLARLVALARLLQPLGLLLRPLLLRRLVRLLALARLAGAFAGLARAQLCFGLMSARPAGRRQPPFWRRSGRLLAAAALLDGAQALRGPVAAFGFVEFQLLAPQQVVLRPGGTARLAQTVLHGKALAAGCLLLLQLRLHGLALLLDARAGRQLAC